MIDDVSYVSNVFSKPPDERQKSCVLILDEVYLKSMMQYHGGIVFGKAVNKPGKLANTIYSTVSHTCRGLVELCKHLLNTTHHEYVMLGKFTSDPIEKEFGKLRQGSGGTYFITVQQMFEKIAITKTKFLLRLDAFT